MTALMVVDTDVLIDYLRGVENAVAFVAKSVDEIVISTVSVAELYAGVRPHERDDLDAFVSLFQVVPLDLSLAQTAGLFKRDYFHSHGMGLADAIVAATAQRLDATLATMNVRHFPMFPNLSPPYSRV